MAFLLFDGTCGFCTAAAVWLERRFARRVHTIPWQQADLRALGLTRDEADRSVWWVEPPRRRFASACAIAHALRACRPPWPRVGRALLVPGVRALAELAYHAVSRVRHWLPGRTPACESGWQDVPRIP